MPKKIFKLFPILFHLNIYSFFKSSRTDLMLLRTKLPAWWRLELTNLLSIRESTKDAFYSNVVFAACLVAIRM